MVSERGTGSQLGLYPAFSSVPLEKLQPQHHVKQTYFLLSLPVHSPAVGLPPASALRGQRYDRNVQKITSRLTPVPDVLMYEKHSGRVLMTVAVEHFHQLLQQQ